MNLPRHCIVPVYWSTAQWVLEEPTTESGHLMMHLKDLRTHPQGCG